MREKIRKIIFAGVTSILIIGVTLFAVSCNDNGVIEAGKQPVIYLDNNGVYIGYVGQELTISPTVDNADDAEYIWTIDGEVVATGPVLAITRNTVATVYATLSVTNDFGRSREEIRIEFIEAPTPSIDAGESPVYVLVGTTRVFSPTFTNITDPDRAIWILDGQKVATGRQYTFTATETGTYTLKISAEGTTGNAGTTITIEVVDQLPFAVYFTPLSALDPLTDRVGVVGRPVYLSPLMTNLTPESYIWTVDGREMGHDPALRFVPQAAGRYVVTVTVSGTTVGSPDPVGASATVIVNVYASQGKIRNGGTSMAAVPVEYVPGPGQFINEIGMTGGFDGSETTPQAAVAYARRRLENGLLVSLGAFGGYLVVGFDHSIVPGTGAYDFTVSGNAFETSSEPGIVWVMQDTNGNGLPDDQWYELRASETGKPTTWTDYAVTYRRGATGAGIAWTDNRGGSGLVPDMSVFHPQPSIYPAWIATDTYTLYGTRVEPRNSIDPKTGQWQNAAYEWGYADNMGSDLIDNGATAGEGRPNGFKVSNAILPDGTPVNLEFIDFVKIQCATVGASGILGEISTEVLGVHAL